MHPKPNAIAEIISSLSLLLKMLVSWGMLSPSRRGPVPRRLSLNARVSHAMARKVCGANSPEWLVRVPRKVGSLGLRRLRLKLVIYEFRRISYQHFG